jgi:exodeoxyribonuclease V alpha subunit
MRSAMLYAMSQIGALGHVYIPRELLFQKMGELLNLRLDEVVLADTLDELLMDRKLIAKQVQEEVRIYTPSLYYSELNSGKMLLDLAAAYEETLTAEDEQARKRLAQIEEKMGLALDDLQKKAVVETVCHGVTIITGGPGTGKTTIINAVIHYFEMEGLELMLAAPTGRAAKRMKEATGYEAKTIHRLLEIAGDASSDTHFKFERNSDNPLETDVVIIDEASMVDIGLMHALLSAIAVGTRLVLVGDVNQLPSVGPGNVLNDLIASKAFATVRLNRIYRQEEGSYIVSNAHKINAGEPIAVSAQSKDFFFLRRASAEEVNDTVVELVEKKMPGYLNVLPQEVQVLAPMRRGEVGVEHLNRLLQLRINPPTPDKNEHESGSRIFREGDKVMQIRNNYKLEWTKQTPDGHELDGGMGVFNGDMGIIRHISDYAEEVTVEYDEGHVVKYPFGFLDELELAYAVTVHKSQGSEYPVVVIPILNGPRMLMTRNLLYTAVTRARSCVVLVGDSGVVGSMIRNNDEQHRYSGLQEVIGQLQQTIG